MHSRIFKIYIPEKEEPNNKENIENGIRELIHKDIEQDIIDSAGWTGMDWFNYTDDGQFKDDVEWLISAYIVDSSNKYKIDKNNFIEVDEKVVYELKGKEFERVKEAIKKELDRRAEEAKKMFRTKDKNAFWFWKVSRTLYPCNGFLFYIEGYGLINDVEFYFSIKDANKIYIVESYDYHF
jgi:DNA primase